MAVSDDRQPASEPAQGAEEGLSLSGVVLQEEGPLHGQRMLRALAVALCLLLLTEGLLRLWLRPDERVLRDPLHPYGCYQEEGLAGLVAERRRDAPGVDVVLMGDSVLSSGLNPPGETVRDYLEAALVRRLGAGVRVWNLGRPGSHAADLYAAVLQLVRALDGVPAAGRAGKRPLLLVLNSNHIFFSRRFAVPSMLYPCLSPGFADDPALIGLLRPPPLPGSVEQALTTWVTRHVYLYQQRRQVSERLFGGPPRDTVRDHLHGWVLRLRALWGPQVREMGEQDRNRPWNERGLVAAQFATAYQFIPLEAREAVNYQMTQRLAALLALHPELTPFVFLTPQNHSLLGALADSPEYHRISAAVVDAFAHAGVRVRSYDNLVADQFFIENDHLSADGNRRLAALLEQDLGPLLPL